MDHGALPLPALLVLSVVYLPHAIALSVVDVREHRLPNRLVLSLTVGVLLIAGAVAILAPASRTTVAAALVLALAGAAIAVAVALVTPELLGMGDAKVLLPVLLTSGLLGWDTLLAGMLGAAILGGLCGAATLLRTRDARARLAYGPVLLAMPLLGLVLAPAVRSGLGV